MSVGNLFNKYKTNSSKSTVTSTILLTVKWKSLLSTLTIERPNQKNVMFLNKNKVSICTTFQLAIWKKVNNSCLLIKYQTKMSYLGYNIHCIKKKDATFWCIFSQNTTIHVICNTKDVYVTSFIHVCVLVNLMHIQGRFKITLWSALKIRRKKQKYKWRVC